MKKFIYLAACMMVVSPTFAAQIIRPATHQEKPRLQGPKVKVIVAEEVASALIEAKGGYRVLDRDNGICLSSGPFGKRYVMHALQNGMRWGEEYPDVYQISLKPENERSSFFVNGLQCKGSLIIYQDSNHKLTIVNELPVEEFLASIMSLKYDTPLAKEAMAALAILERTAIYKRMELSRSENGILFDYRAEEVNYQGYGVTKQCVGIDEAVVATRFMVMEGNKGKESRYDIQKIEALAHKGLDAKQILSSYFPHASIGLTMNVPSKIVR